MNDSLFAILKKNGRKVVLIPNIDYSRCKGCGACAEIYPTIFTMRQEKAWVISDEGIDGKDQTKIVNLCAFGAISFE